MPDRIATMWLMLAALTFGVGLHILFGLWTLSIILSLVIIVKIYEGIHDRR